MKFPSIDSNERIKVIKPPVGHPELLGSKLRVVGIEDGYVLSRGECRGGDDEKTGDILRIL